MKATILYPLADQFDVDISSVAGVPLDDQLEYIFDRMNAGSGREGPELEGRRSLSVGDIVTINGIDFLCCGCGWTKIDKETRERYLTQVKAEGQRMMDKGFVVGVPENRRWKVLGFAAQSQVVFYFDKSHQEI
jgi:hypothetical protein